ncbi:MAG: DUF5069 domain-containing protein [Verrucomicrobiota bacterium]
MEKIIPLISSETAGPLGVRHLPRLWLKALLAALGRLPEGYKDIRPGFDLMVLEGLRIDPEAARAFINAEQPGYLEFETWIRRQPDADLSTANIDRVNGIVTSRVKGEESRRQILEENGLPPDSPIADSVMLNNLIDWKELHDSLQVR